ncbi:MAG TPA: N-acetylglucosamine/diacetylchitobiose ABC transporter substrate-binding protein [Thermomicrobiales bacterium]|nr:N-acetylglucosamine/diacetylchitobiose ABC transporter substrate-binding protein [Thermomicrobiales bacterium]
MTKDQVSRIDQLFREVAEKGMSRRQMIQRAAVLGISASALSVAFVQKAHVAVAQGAENPLGVDPAAPLDVVIFKGGYGDDYAINVNDNFYKKLYPDAEITYAGTQRLQEQYQARFVDGNPPDVMDNSGAGNFNNTTLINEGQLADLAPLMEAEAYGQPGVTFADSLLPGTQETGVFDGKQYYLNYVYSVNGIWYNQALFDENGWEYPTTWDDMLALCQTIKDSGIAPWTYQGQYPQYIRSPFDQMVWKTGGWDAMLKLDNLAEDAWTQDVVKQALEAWKALYDQGFILEGTEALSHTESQAQWLQGKAAFIPCGSWLANEMKDVIPEGFAMTVKATPSLTGSDALPQTAIQAAAGETFIVPAQAKNAAGGMEWLRLLFSKEAAEFFAEQVQSLTAVKGAGEGKDFGTAFNSALEANSAAGSDTFPGSRYAGWYSDLDEETRNQFGLLMTGQTSVDDMVSTLQDLVNQIREDDSIPKFTREAPAASPEATPAS